MVLFAIVNLFYIQIKIYINIQLSQLNVVGVGDLSMESWVRNNCMN